MGKNPTIVSDNNYSKYTENNIQRIKRRSINFAEICWDVCWVFPTKQICPIVYHAENSKATNRVGSQQMGEAVGKCGDWKHQSMLITRMVRRRRG